MAECLASFGIAGQKPVMGPVLKFIPRLVTVSLTTGLSVFATTAFAGDISHPKRVVELFTSQGCSSCPPANKYVAQLAEGDTETLALSFGVTYWDYLGWKDTTGDPSFTDRQRHYRDALQTKLYTPQIVVNGADHAPRWKDPALHAHSLKTTVELKQDASALHLEGDIPTRAPIALVSYQAGLHSVDVGRGENRGHTLSLANVVTHIDYVIWDGKPVEITAPKDALAVLVHDPADGSIIAAVDYRADT